jgi:alpha-amylase
VGSYGAVSGAGAGRLRPARVATSIRGARRAWIALLAFSAGIAGSAAAAPLNGRTPVDDIFYQFMPIAWRDSDNDAARFGDFGGMTASLDYLEELGVTAVWMNPIFPSPGYHGYQHDRADQVDARFGSEAEFLAFVQAAHARGIKVFVDLVAYGISGHSTWFLSAYGRPSSPYDDWLAFTDATNLQYLGGTYTTWNGAPVPFCHWNLNNPGPVTLVTDWAKHWLDPNGDGDPNDGIDGYRLDHVWAHYNSGPNGWGYNIDTFWVPWKQALQTVNPDVFTFAEQADWSSRGADLLPAHDAAMTKPFEAAARSALVAESAAGLYAEMDATVGALPAGKLFVAIIGDHDVDRLTSVLGGNLSKARAAAAILLTQPFPPILYYGDEIGMRGTKTPGYVGDADDIPFREPFKWNAVAGPPMSNYFVLNSAAYAGRVERDNDGRSVEEQRNVPGSLLEEYKLLIAARKAHVALRRGSYAAVPATDTAVWAFVRHQPAEETMLVAIHLKGQTATPSLNLVNFTIPGGATSVVDVLSGATLPDLTDANRAAYPLDVPAYGYRLLAVQVVPNAPTLNNVDGANIPSDLGPGALRATQNNATGWGDNVNELDQLFVRVLPTALQVGITGNLAADGTGMALFFDTVPGGQNTLVTSALPVPPHGLPELNGLVFDSGFAPDFAVFVTAWSGTLYVNRYTLATTGGGTRQIVGRASLNTGTGRLTGGTNPNNMLVALNTTNTAGVTATSAVDAATATCGFELLVPFADLGLTASLGTVRVLALELKSDGLVGNQFLPGLGGGQANLGYVPINLNTIPGQQYVSVPLEHVPGDGDGNGIVDESDLAHLIDCLGSPGGGVLGPGCSAFDFDADNTVDLRDLAAFQGYFAP